MRKISASFPTTFALLVGSCLLTKISALCRYRRESVRDRSGPQHSSAQHMPDPQVSGPTQSQWLSPSGSTSSSAICSKVRRPRWRKTCSKPTPMKASCLKTWKSSVCWSLKVFSARSNSSGSAPCNCLSQMLKVWGTHKDIFAL